MDKVTRIAVLTDAHANLPALEAVMRDIREQKCDVIYHTGDAIAIGPFPKETLELLLKTPDMHLLKGNHEMYYAYGIPDPKPTYMDADEEAHQRWVRKSIGESLRETVGGLPLVNKEVYGGVSMTFLHFALDENESFLSGTKPHEVAWLDEHMGKYGSQLVFFGHDHVPCDMTGKARYISPGPLSLSAAPKAHYVIVECSSGKYRIENHEVAYDAEPLWKAFADRDVPARDFVLKVFFKHVP